MINHRPSLFLAFACCVLVVVLLPCCTDDKHDLASSENNAKIMEGLRKRGKSLREQCQFVDAIACHRQVCELAEQEKDTTEWVMALNELGTSYRRIGALDDAIEAHHKALLLTLSTNWQQDKQAQKNRVVSLNGLGNIYLTINAYDRADSVLRLALAGERQLGSALGQAINLANLGSIKETKGETDSAWVYYRQSLQKNEECQSTLGLSLCHNHFGRLYEQAGQLDSALTEYETARKLMKDSPDQWHGLEAVLNMVRVHIIKHNYAEAKELLGQADKTACNIGSLEHRAEVQKLMYQLYQSQDDYKRALQYYLRYDELSDSIIDLNKLLQIQNTRLELERGMREQKEEEASVRLAEEKSINQILMVTAAAILLLAVVFIITLWYTLHIRGTKHRMARQTQIARESFFTNITHEFRTPLTVILGLGHQLEEDGVEDVRQVRSAAKMIVRQSNSLLELINQLLDISKVRSSIGTPHWSRGNIVAFVAMIIENFKPCADSKRIELTFSHSLTQIEMDFVADYMKKIIANLLSNAIKFTPNYGKVNVTLEKTSGNRLKLQVFDTGKGIEPQDLPHLFDAFYQADKNNYSMGTGIGLSLVKLTTEAMGGSVEAQSIPNQGSTFTVTLPIVMREDSRPLEAPDAAGQQTFAGQPDLPAADGEAPTGTDAGTRILIVEDNQDIAYYIGMHLEKAGQLYYARTGEEALQKARETMPDLIITDVMMPGDIDGLQLCRTIRDDELTSQTPIIIITAKTAEGDRVKGLEAGADAYLVKPFNSEELQVRVDKLLERQRKVRSLLAKQQTDEALDLEQMSAEDRKFMNRVTDAVYRLMAQGKTDIDSLAGQMALSRSQLNRKVLAITGQNTSGYMMRLRLIKAKRLLKCNPELSVGHVATKCGFDDIAYFSRIFKQNCGMTPSQYRKQ